MPIQVVGKGAFFCRFFSPRRAIYSLPDSVLSWTWLTIADIFAGAQAVFGPEQAVIMQTMPTRYNSLLYRSRCEARWAVVFDKLGWAHCYEPEAYRLPSGPYLPDFYLPSARIFFEVKGIAPSPQERRKASELCVATRTPVIISTSAPNPNRNEIDDDLVVFYPELIDDGFEAFEYDGVFVSGRFSYHPACSLHLGNLSYIGACNEIAWRDAFRAAANERFGIYPSELR
jgi:hypothetical protein